jgi:hypothetical protein
MAASYAPYDIWFMIVDVLAEDARSLASCARVSRLLCDAARPVLYRKILVEYVAAMEGQHKIVKVSV